jgi:hypothetical protein
VNVDDSSAWLALEAARLSLNTEDAVLWTQDAHFRGPEKVEFREKPVTAG